MENYAIEKHIKFLEKSAEESKKAADENPDNFFLQIVAKNQLDALIDAKKSASDWRHAPF